MKEELTVRRLIPAAPAVVFDFWTQAEHVKKWWGPKAVTCPEAEIDLRVGGQYRIANLLPDGEIIWIHGEFELIEPPSLLRYTWAFGLDTPPTERITVRFEPAEGGTSLTILHENVPAGPRRDGHEQGWIGCLEGLVEYTAIA